MFRMIYIVSCLLLLSCSAEWHTRRAIAKSSPQEVLDYITTKYPNYIKQKDTLIYDTTYIHYRSLDTSWVARSIDTLIVNNNNLQTKIIRHYDTIYVKMDARKDTIVKRIRVPQFVVKEEVKQNSWKWTLIGAIIAELITVIILLLYAAKR